jgi:hypothetical protein
MGQNLVDRRMAAIGCDVDHARVSSRESPAVSVVRSVRPIAMPATVVVAVDRGARADRNHKLAGPAGLRQRKQHRTAQQNA